MHTSQIFLQWVKTYASLEYNLVGGLYVLLLVTHRRCVSRMGNANAVSFLFNTWSARRAILRPCVEGYTAVGHRGERVGLFSGGWHMLI